MSTTTTRGCPARAAAAVAAALVACLATTSAPAAAQDNDASDRASTWSVQPATADGADGRASFDYQLPPGTSIDDYAQINNFSDQPLTLRVYSQDAVNTPTGGYTLLPGDQPPADVGAWIGLHEQVSVPPGDSEVVAFTLTVPDNATPGDHPGGIVASLTSGATDQQGNPVLVDHRVGSRIYLRVNGEFNPALQISQVETGWSRSPIPFTSGQLSVTYLVRNVGNVRLQGEQSLTVRGLFGLGERTVTLPGLPEILPGQTVGFTQQVADVPPLVRLGTRVSAQPMPPPQLSQDQVPVPVSAQTFIWVLPWPELLVLLAVGLLVWAWWWRRRRSRRRTAATLAAAVAKAREQARREAQQPEPQPASRPQPAGQTTPDARQEAVAGSGDQQP